MFRIGLTGGIAAGKSAASARFAALGLIVIDHDQLAHQAVAPQSQGLAQVVAEFGPGVLTTSGELDRPQLGKLVFGDSELLAKLNAIVHPQVLALSQAAESAAAAKDYNAIIVHDIPLLIETGQQHDFDELVVVMAPEEVRVNRLVSGRGLTREDALKRVSAQTTDVMRLRFATTVLDGAGEISHLNSQIDSLVARIRSQNALDTQK